MSWSVADESVTHERLGDEVVAIAFESGIYYSMRGVAADCWTLVAGGCDEVGVADAITSRYDVDLETASTDIATLLGALEREGLLVPHGGEASVPNPPAPAADPRLAYAAPTFERFDDMRELLLLDPIHEVDDAGWPVPLPESA